MLHQVLRFKRVPDGFFVWWAVRMQFQISSASMNRRREKENTFETRRNGGSGGCLLHFLTPSLPPFTPFLRVSKVFASMLNAAVDRIVCSH
jgi:hypothetical protein